MNGSKILDSVWLLACLLAPGSPTSAQDLEIEKGFDLFRTAEELAVEQSFAGCPIPGTAFEQASIPPLTGCDLFMGTVPLTGEPLEEFRGVTVGAVDTIVERKNTIDFGKPTENVTSAAEIAMVALNLVSVTSIEILCNEGITHWRVDVEIDDRTGPSTGEMAVTLEAPKFEGGTIFSEIDICPRVSFTRIDSETSGSFEIFPCELLCGSSLVGYASWAFEADEPGRVLRIDGLTTGNFYLISPGEPPSTASVTESVCAFRYPHLDASHRHQSCVPAPCTRDIEPPALVVPAPETCRSTGRGGASIHDKCIQAWLAKVSCPDELSESTCGPLEPPDFFPSAQGDGYETTVTFIATDKCGNSTSATSTLTLKEPGPSFDE